MPIAPAGRRATITAGGLPRRCAASVRGAGRLWATAVLCIAAPLASAAGPLASTAPARAQADAVRPGTGCPPIRPPALGREALHRLVLSRLAVALQRPIGQVDLNRSYADQAPSDAALQGYRYAALAIGEALGFDAPARFAEAARRRGTAGPQQELTVRHLLALSLNAYQEGLDAPPPAAEPQAVFTLEGLQVRPPAPDDGPVWRLTRCGHDQVAFQRLAETEDAAAAPLTSAVARLTALPPWAGTGHFIDYLQGVLVRTAPEGHHVEQAEVQPLDLPGRRCAQARLLASDGEHAYRMLARFCYAPGDSRHGPTLMYSQTDAGDAAAFEAAAQAFFARQIP